MTSIYRLGYKEEAEYLKFVNDDDLHVCLKDFDGSPLTKVKIIEVNRLLLSGQDQNISETDVAYLLDIILILTEKAKKVLDPAIKNYGEWIGVDAENKKFHAFNVICNLDAFDIENSKCDFSPRTGKLLNVDKYCLRYSSINEEPIFKMKNVWCSPIFVSQEFKSRIEDTELSGFAFEEIDLL